MPNYPIPYNPSWEIRDSSKLTDFASCPRYFLYRHLLGWRPEGPSHDLYFGEAVHRAMAELFENGYTNPLSAIDAFKDYYQREYDLNSDLFLPKTYRAIIELIPMYCAFYADDPSRFKVLHTEIAGSVQIHKDRLMYFRLDTILEDQEDGSIISMDHKTTKMSVQRELWQMQFPLSFQTGTYTHVLYSYFFNQIERVKGVIYNGLQFKHLKTRGYEFDFKRVPAYKTKLQMADWLWTINDLCAQLEGELQSLEASSDSDLVLRAFPKNPTSCTKFFGCEYHTYCCTWPNPLQHCENPPLGFMVEFWDPREVEAKERVELEMPK